MKAHTTRATTTVPVTVPVLLRPETTRTIIYLPPFCYPCKHVPATQTTITTVKTSATGSSIGGGVGVGEDDGNNVSVSYVSGNVTTTASDYGSCCQRRWEHKNYDKHGTPTTLTPTLNTTTTTATAKTTTTTTRTAFTARRAANATSTSMLTPMNRDAVQDTQEEIDDEANRITQNTSSSNNNINSRVEDDKDKDTSSHSCSSSSSCAHWNFLQKQQQQHRIALDSDTLSNACSATKCDLRQKQNQLGKLEQIKLQHGKNSAPEEDEEDEVDELKVDGKRAVDVSILPDSTKLRNIQLVMPIGKGVMAATTLKSAECRLENVTTMRDMSSSVVEVVAAAKTMPEYSGSEATKAVESRQSYASLTENNVEKAMAVTEATAEPAEKTKTITATNTNTTNENTTMKANVAQMKPELELEKMAATYNNSHTTMTTRMTAMTTAATTHNDECRCFKYNSDIRTLGKVRRNATDCCWIKRNVETVQEQQQQHLRNYLGIQKTEVMVKMTLTLTAEAQAQECERKFPRRLQHTMLLLNEFWRQQQQPQLVHKSEEAKGTTLVAAVAACLRRRGSSSMNAAKSVTARTTATTTTMTMLKSWLALLLMLMLSTQANCYGRQDVPTNCTFPARWEGSWFLSGYQQSIHIKGSQFSYRGRCAASDGNKYLIVDEKGCHRCLVIYEKHKNVLQYKESECEGDSMYMHQSNPSALAMRSSLKQSDHRGGAHPNTNGHSRLSSSDQYIMRSNDDTIDYFCKGRETLQNLCDQIPGDALLYSLFRESAEPVKCPLKGPFIFTYNRGHGECKSPVSNIESCTEDSRLLLSFQACPDVQGTESTVEELTCLATWKDGNSRYLVGLVSHHHAISNEERYRCFVYEKISSLMGGPSMLSSKDAEYKLAQSGDATCNGLDSAEVGSRIMSLRKPPLAERCDFPVWFKGPRHWHALMGNAVYNYHSNDGSVHIIKPNGYMETRALCEQINKQTATEMMAVVHYTTGCQSGFMCMIFYRRDTHVIEIQTGKPVNRLEDACAPEYFDISKMAYITLLASNPDPQICPMEGLYNLRGAIGPPYLTTRHKRNHNNKMHLGHGHHHHESDLAAVGSFGHKRHSTLSFRNAEHIEKGAWHGNTRGLPVRTRRDTHNEDRKQDLAFNSNSKELLLSDVAALNDTSVGFVSRNRRDVPGCITNYKAQRQLKVGCTAENVIDVNPLCTEDGDEEYLCHGTWTENATVYIIARHKGTKHGVCISYRPTEGTSAKLVIGDACYRGIQKPPDHHLVANLSVFGKCGDTSSSSTTHTHIANWLIISAVALFGFLLSAYSLDSEYEAFALR